MARDLSFLDEGIAGGSRLTGRKDIPTVSEEDINAAVRKAGEDLGVDKSILAYEAGAAGDYSSFSKMTPAEKTAFQKGRLEKQTQEREFGTTDNPQPYEAPKGTHWNNYNGIWYLYNANNIRIGDANGYDETKINVGSSNGGNGGNGGNVTGATGPNTTGQTFTSSDGKTFNNYSDYITYQAKLDSEKNARQSAYDLLYSQFKQYGLESLVEGIKGLIQENVSPSEFAIRLQDTDAYKKRFAANQDRIKAGLRALTPAEYIGLEDQYQNIMRNYGLPASYWSKDSMGTQAGFNKFIANDVSAAELEDRIMTAQKRVLNADVNVKDALRAFYPDITDADILAYILDPTNALENIKRKVTAAEIQGAAVGQGLNKITAFTPEAQVKALEARARELAGLGVTAAQAQQGYGAIAEFLPTATKLGDIYAKQGMGPYDQLTAEQEVFGTRGAAQAAQKRKKLSQLEQAAFSGVAGQAQGALARDRAGSI